MLERQREGIVVARAKGLSSHSYFPMVSRYILIAVRQSLIVINNLTALNYSYMWRYDMGLNLKVKKHMRAVSEALRA